MLQPGQLPRQLLIDPQQARDLRGQRHDLPILTPHKSEQLLTRHLLRRGHPKIKLRPDEHTHDQHTEINNFARKRSVPTVMQGKTAREHHPIHPTRRPERPR